MKVSRLVAYILLYTLFGGGPKLWAEEINALLPATFKLVHSLDELSDNDFFLIIGKAGKDNYYVLTDKDYKGKLHAKPLNWDELPTATDFDSANAIWKITSTASGNYCIQCAEDGQYIFAGKGNSTNLAMNNATATEWNASVQDGLFRFENAGTPGRFLGINDFDVYTVFGNYNSCDSEWLYLYKMARKIADLPGEATQPEDNEVVGLYGGGQVAQPDLSATDAENYLLRNGELAFDPLIGQWTCHYTANGFSLQSSDGLYLGYDLKSATTPAIWKITNGYITTSEAVPRYLVYTGQFKLIDSESPVSNGVKAAMLLPVSARPEAEVVGNTAVLSGGWTASALAEIPWDNILALDLTGVVLPAAVRPFQGQSANSIIYIQADDAPFVPAQWKFVVCCPEDGENFLLSDAEILDGYSLYIDRPFHVSAGQLTYTRQAYADGMWETLYLPFEAAAPDDFKVEKYARYDAGSQELYFEATEEIPAAEAVIFRYTGSTTSETVPFAVTCKEGTVMPEESSNQGSQGLELCGTFQPLTFNQAPYYVYLLNETGENFQRAATGSSLSAFRAYLKSTALSNQVRISHPQPTSIPSAASSRRDGSPCYRADGTLFRITITSKGLRDLPTGLYIWKGEKFIIK